MSAIEDRPLAELGQTLARLGTPRFWLCWDDSARSLRASNSALQPFAARVAANDRDFDGHEGVFGEWVDELGVLLLAVVHRTCRGQGAGGVRLWRYPTFGEALTDGLRLSRGMTRKNALAGLWWGGGKGVIAHGAVSTWATGRRAPRSIEPMGASSPRCRAATSRPKT